MLLRLLSLAASMATIKSHGMQTDWLHALAEWASSWPDARLPWQLNLAAGGQPVTDSFATHQQAIRGFAQGQAEATVPKQRFLGNDL